jgi:hypothetical protein
MYSEATACMRQLMCTAVSQLSSAQLIPLHHIALLLYPACLFFSYIPSDFISLLSYIPSLLLLALPYLLACHVRCMSKERCVCSYVIYGQGI